MRLDFHYFSIGASQESSWSPCSRENLIQSHVCCCSRSLDFRESLGKLAPSLHQNLLSICQPCHLDGVACRPCHICHVPRFTLCRGPLRGLASAWQFGAGLSSLVSQSQGHDIEAILLWISVDNFLLLKTHKAVSALFLLIGVRILQQSERGRLTSDVTGSQFWNQKLYVLSTSQQKWISALLAEQTFH